MLHLKDTYPQIKISFFVPFINKDNVSVPGVFAKDADLFNELFRFKEGYYLMLVEELRKIKLKEDRQRYKSGNLPAFTFGCSFKKNDYRKQSNVESTNNILYIDIDGVGIDAYLKKKSEKSYGYTIESLRDELFYDLPCIFAGLSCSGTGIFLLIQHKPEERIDAFEDVVDYIQMKYNIVVDAACRDIGRLTFATYDPSALIRPSDEISSWNVRKEYIDRKKKLIEERSQNFNKVILKNPEEFSSVIMTRAINLIQNAREGERHNRIRAAARLLGGYVATNVFSESYVEESLIRAVESIDYDDMQDAKKAIKYGIANGKLNPIQVDVVTPDDPQYAFFVEQSQERQREINKLYLDIRQKIKSGVQIDKVDCELLASTYYVDAVRVKDILHDLYKKYHYEFNIEKMPNIAKVEAFLTGKYELKRDVITDDVFFKYKGTGTWEVLRYENLWRDLQRNAFKFKYDDLVRLLRSEYVPTVNAWEEHFSALGMKEKSVDYIDTLANHIICKDPKEQPYFNVMFKKMLVRAIKCGLEDFYANRTVFVLVSETQNNGKSTFIRWLNPFGPHKYYAENPLEDNKDARLRISETFIYNLEELSTITKFEINRLKAIVSQIGTRDRKPYARQAENIVRRCSFFGSTNQNMFLTDDVNTRWLCFDIKFINWDYSKNIDKNDVWAQAYQLYKSGYNCELTKEEGSTRDTINKNFEITNVEGDLLMKYFKPAEPFDHGAVFMTSTSVHETLLMMTKESRINISNVWVGRCLKKLGYIRQRYNNVYGYWVRPINQTPYTNYTNDGQQSGTDDYYEPPPF